MLDVRSQPVDVLARRRHSHRLWLWARYGAYAARAADLRQSHRSRPRQGPAMPSSTVSATALSQCWSGCTGLPACLVSAGGAHAQLLEVPGQQLRGLLLSLCALKGCHQQLVANPQIIESMVEEPGHKFHGRVHVQYNDTGATYWCRPDTLRQPTTVRRNPTPNQQHACTAQVTVPWALLAAQAKGRVVVVESTREYRQLARDLVDAKDVVLEVGCAEGRLCLRRCVLSSLSSSAGSPKTT